MPIWSLPLPPFHQIAFSGPAAVAEEVAGGRVFDVSRRLPVDDDLVRPRGLPSLTAPKSCAGALRAAQGTGKGAVDHHPAGLIQLGRSAPWAASPRVALAGRVEAGLAFVVIASGQPELVARP
jgi:hypothetical protein